jgi:hypothetical protein
MGFIMSSTPALEATPGSTGGITWPTWRRGFFRSSAGDFEVAALKAVRQTARTHVRDGPLSIM